jgi:hypothetical protein
MFEKKPRPAKQEPEVLWDYTENGIGYAKSLNQYRVKTNEQGKRVEYFKGYRIISRDTPINGGISFTSVREGIIVDDQKDQKIKQVYQTVLDEITNIKKRGGNYKAEILDFIYVLVGKVMPTNSNKIHEAEKAGKLGEGKTILLGDLLGAGVCRHQSLLVGYLIEKLINDGYLRGRVSIDRNQKKDIGGHAWARYTSRAGEIAIIDVTQEYRGKLDLNNSTCWPYARPEDIGISSKNTMVSIPT